ncbi:ribokinase [Rhizocola hellebori]|uniref:Ribokinase n=1 Tax=Rhizocola hellebori TaxID=1392758 RepID=A0A8J3Q2I0_9ACTN|nr:ribokinase [Rhizocola hellebori]GIH02446.1 ribokinase [Rhizocola hellebori]
MSSAIWVVGSLNVDLTLSVPSLPRAGETVVGGQLQSRPGGKGANQAVACARQGAVTHLVAQVGRDFDTSWADRFAELGVQPHLRVSPTQPTGVALVMVEESGENLIGVFPGANAELSVSELPVHPGDLLLLQGEVAVEVNVAAAQAVKANGGKVVLNAAPAFLVPAEMPIDLLVVNELEFAVVGRDAAPWVVVTQGAAGATLLGPQGESQRQPGFPVRAADTVGAGDTFVGALAASWLTGQTLADAVRWACAAAAIAVTRPGIHEAIPTARQVADFLARQVGEGP